MFSRFEENAFIVLRFLPIKTVLDYVVVFVLDV